jgi:hypothetical protein
VRLFRRRLSSCPQSAVRPDPACAASPRSDATDARTRAAAGRDRRGRRVHIPPGGL